MDAPDWEILSLIRIVIGFIVCFALTTGGAVISFIGILDAGEIAFLKSPNPDRGVPILITGAVVFLGAFPIGAWFLRSDLRALAPFGLFPDELTVLFACSIGFWIVSIIVFNYSAGNWRKWFPKNGKQRSYYKNLKLWRVQNFKNNILDGESVYYLPDGTVYFDAKFENGKLSGRVLQYNSENVENDRTVSYYFPAGNLVAKKRIRNNLIEEHYSESTGRKTQFNYTETGIMWVENISFIEKDFSGEETVAKYIRREFDRTNGKILKEVVMDYKNNHQCRVREFDPQTGKMISEKID